MPPVVHAPHRPVDTTVPAGAAPAPLGQSEPVASAPGGGSSGTVVTAVVGGAPGPAGAPGGGPGTPTTTTTARAPGLPDGGLARTGADVGLVLLFALLAVLLGALLVRLGSRPVRPARTC